MIRKPHTSFRAKPALAPSRVPGLAPGWGWTIALAAVLVLGGGNWTMPLPRLLAEGLAIGMLVAAIGSARWPEDLRMTAADWIWVALLALFIAHLVPLPPALWTALPGRATAVLSDRAVFGAPLWRPFSLDPQATWRSLLMLLPAFALYLAVRLGNPERHLALLRGAALAGLAAVGLALTQLSLPAAEWLRPYPRGDYALPIGFFINRNHQATFLLCTLPLAGAWLALCAKEHGTGQTRGTARAPWLLGVFALFVATGVLVTISRSGAALLPIAFAGTLLAWTASGHTGTARAWRRRIWLVLGLFGALIATGLFIAALGGDGLTGVLRRDGPAGDARFDFWPSVVAAAMRFWPVGSGIGTFLDGYEMHEPLEILGPLYLNHAHNDYLEILLEAGVPGMVLALAGIWELALMARTGWREGGAACRMAAVCLLLPVLHSLVDYPLRTISISCLAALAAGLLAAGNNAVAAERKREHDLAG